MHLYPEPGIDYEHGWAACTMGAMDGVVTFDDVREAADVVAPQHGVSEMYVYGSVARRGNHIDSDVDLIYSMGPGHKATVAPSWA